MADVLKDNDMGDMMNISKFDPENASKSQMRSVKVPGLES